MRSHLISFVICNKCEAYRKPAPQHNFPAIHSSRKTISVCAQILLNTDAPHLLVVQDPFTALIFFLWSHKYIVFQSAAPLTPKSQIWTDY